MSNIDISVMSVRVTNYVLTVVAVLVTVFRLWDRARAARLWWDDAWAFFTMILLITFMGLVEVHLQDPRDHPKSLKVKLAYLVAVFFYAVNWSARISILLTIIRLSYGTVRRVLFWIGVSFIATWAILFGQIFWVCNANTSWQRDASPQCPLGLSVAIAQVITDVLCDLILVLMPLFMVWRTKLSRAQKIRIAAIFSTTILATGISLNHVYFVLKTGGLGEALAAVLQCTVSLIVASLSVIIAYFFRISTEDDDDTPESTAKTTTTTYFTFNRQKGDQAALPITSTFITTNGGVRERSDEFETKESRQDSDFEMSTVKFKISA